jgi:hypothetical protein
VASLTGGTEGLKNLFFRCFQWRVGFKWYALALLTPIVIALTTVTLTIVLGAQIPTGAQFGNWYDVLLLFPIALVDAPLWEESGWRGFAFPRFPTERSRLSNTLILGLLLAGWHLPIALGGGALAVPYLLAAVGSAVVTNWVYYGAKESALFAILYHTAANTMGIYLFQMFNEAEKVKLYWLLAAINWLAAVIIIALSSNFRHRDSAQRIEVQ